jgi:hypothetical protein
MKKLTAPFFVLFSKFNRQHLQLIFAIIVLSMLVLGAGAPEDGGAIHLAR